MASRRVSEELTVLYDGPALAEHRMSVRDLAPALLGFADAVERAQQLVAPGYPVKLEVQATAAASFDIEMIVNVLPQIYGHAVTLLTSPKMTAALAMKDIVSSVVGAVLIARSISRHGGKPTAEAVPPVGDGPEPPQVRLSYPDGTVLEVTGASWLVYNDGGAMFGLSEAVKPLAVDGVETFAIQRGDSTTVVESSDRGGFSPDVATESVLLDRTDPMMLQPVDITFRHGGKWKVSDGTSRFYVRVEDHAFSERVEKGVERFGKADIIHAIVRTVQTKTPDGLRTDRTIVQVVSHTAGGQQGTLEYLSDDDQ